MYAERAQDELSSSLRLHVEARWQLEEQQEVMQQYCSSQLSGANVAVHSILACHVHKR
jgi:hypothetical protein